jgi:hypothetical protein
MPIKIIFNQEIMNKRRLYVKKAIDLFQIRPSLAGYGNNSIKKQ